MTTIIAAIIPILFKIAGFLVERSNASREQKESYLKFISAYNRMGNASLKQKEDIEKQLADFKSKETAAETTKKQ